MQRIRRAHPRLTWGTASALLLAAVLCRCPPAPADDVATAGPADASAVVPGSLLVATRSLLDVHFGESVVYILRHDQLGTQGVIVNKPMGVPARQALPNLADVIGSEHAVFFGGPVGIGAILVLAGSSTPIPGAEPVTENVALINDTGVLRLLLSNADPPPPVRFFAGYAGWAPGQLDEELERGDWLLKAPRAGVLFRTQPETLWRDLIGLGGGQWVHHENHLRQENTRRR